MVKQFKKSRTTNSTNKSEIENIIKPILNRLINRKDEDRKRFIQIDQYGELIDMLIGLSDGEKYYIRPVTFYADESELEVEENYYKDAVEKYGFESCEKFIRGLEIIARSISPGFVELLRNYGFIMTEAETKESGMKLVFDHIAFHR